MITPHQAVFTGVPSPDSFGAPSRDSLVDDARGPKMSGVRGPKTTTWRENLGFFLYMSGPFLVIAGAGVAVSTAILGTTKPKSKRGKK